MIRFVFLRTVLAAMWRMEWKGERVNTGSGDVGKESGNAKTELVEGKTIDTQTTMGLAGIEKKKMKKLVDRS